MKRIVVSLLCSALFGCAASYHREELTAGTTSTSKVAIPSASSVYVTLPADGTYEEKIYGGSGRMTEQAVAAAFARNGARVVRGETIESRKQTITSAQSNGAQYVAMATIVQWEPRATEWSGKPSRLSIDMTLIEVESGRTINEEALTARSRIVSFTGTSPESLLRDSVGQYVDSLYKRPLRGAAQ